MNSDAELQTGVFVFIQVTISGRCACKVNPADNWPVKGKETFAKMMAPQRVITSKNNLWRKLYIYYVHPWNATSVILKK